jgi:hypothetical protein
METSSAESGLNPTRQASYMIPLRVICLEREDSLGLDTALRPIDIGEMAVNDKQEEEINSNNNPLGTELQNQYQQPSQPGIQI